jgi:hypothetical protein
VSEAVKRLSVGARTSKHRTLVQSMAGKRVYTPAYTGADADPVRDLGGHDISNPSVSEDGPPAETSGSFTGHSMGSKGGKYFLTMSL